MKPKIEKGGNERLTYEHTEEIQMIYNKSVNMLISNVIMIIIILIIIPKHGARFS